MAKALRILTGIFLTMAVRCVSEQFDESPVSDSCPAGFSHLEEVSGCYQLNSKQLTWDEAMSSCQAMGANLATVTSQSQQEAIMRFTNRLTANSHKQCRNQVWLGGQTERPDICGTPFMWKTNKGPMTLITYNNWSAGNPSCSNTGENCLAYVSGHFVDSNYESLNGVWNDLPCEERLCYLCQHLQK